MPSDKVTYLIGAPAVTSRALPIFDTTVCAFLADLSSALRTDEKAKIYADLQTFAFWCRPAHIERLKTRYLGQSRMGRGIAFHIAPANVPVNTAYSLAFGLLSGNANIVRVPSRAMPQIDVLSESLNRLLSQPKYQTVREMTSLVRYAADNEITGAFSAQCDARIMWGGDETVRHIRALPLPVRAVELAFADRYSLALLNAGYIVKLGDAELVKLADGFYNDTYLMDQNACSSPQLVLWQGGEEVIRQAQELFWQAVAARVEARYDLMPAQAVEKYTMLLDAAIAGSVRRLRRHGNHVYAVEADSLEKAQERLRGKFGLFYEQRIDDLNALIELATPKLQTLAYAGFDKEKLRDFVMQNRVQGIDRIVPVGKALDIDIIWDGYDVIGALSRLIDAQ